MDHTESSLPLEDQPDQEVMDFFPDFIFPLPYTSDLGFKRPADSMPPANVQNEMEDRIRCERLRFVGPGIKIKVLDTLLFGELPYISVAAVERSNKLNISDVWIKAVKGEIPLYARIPQCSDVYEVDTFLSREQVLSNPPSLLKLKTRDVQDIYDIQETMIDEFDGGYLIDSEMNVHNLDRRFFTDAATVIWSLGSFSYRHPIRVSKGSLFLFANDLFDILGDSVNVPPVVEEVLAGESGKNIEIKDISVKPPHGHTMNAKIRRSRITTIALDYQKDHPEKCISRAKWAKALFDARKVELVAAYGKVSVDYIKDHLDKNKLKASEKPPKLLA